MRNAEYGRGHSQSLHRGKERNPIASSSPQKRTPPHSAHRILHSAFGDGPALITGGGSGIGRGVALALARRGVDVALVGRRTAPLAVTARAAATYGVRAVSLPADITDRTARTALPERVRAALGPVRILVHCAGVLAGGELGDLADGALEQAITVNLIAPLDLTRRLLPDLIAGRGAIVLVASETALVPLPAAAVYSAGKAGLRAAAASLRYELAPQGVHLLLAYPSATATALTHGMAAAAGLLAYPLAHPAAVGERIVLALESGRTTLPPTPGDRLLAWAYTLAPWLVCAILQSQRMRFRRMFAENQVEGDGD